MKIIPNSYNRTKLLRLVRGLCIQCGKNKVGKFRWCITCRIKINADYKQKSIY